MPDWVDCMTHVRFTVPVKSESPLPAVGDGDGDGDGEAMRAFELLCIHPSSTSARYTQSPVRVLHQDLSSNGRSNVRSGPFQGQGPVLHRRYADLTISCGCTVLQVQGSDMRHSGSDEGAAVSTARLTPQDDPAYAMRSRKR